MTQKLQSNAQHDPLLKLQQHNLKQAMRSQLNVLSQGDTHAETLFKYHTILASVAYNFDQFNRKLEAELRGEDEALYQLISTTRMLELQDNMNALYATAEQMTKEISQAMGEVKKYVTLAQSVAQVDPNTMDKTKIKVPQASFDRLNNLHI